MADSTCAIEGCTRALLARGWCSMHYQRWRNGGTLTQGRGPVREQCEVASCDRPPRSPRSALCTAHYVRKQRHGDVREGMPVQERRDRCSTDGCDRPHYSHGMCILHLRRAETIGKVYAKRKRMDLGSNRECNTCGLLLQADEFASKSTVCNRCALLRTYKLTRVEWDALLESQDGGCAACGTTNPGGNGWHTDHDHSCCPSRSSSCGQCVRGILCSSCNLAIGLMRDDAARLRKAAAYLERGDPHGARNRSGDRLVHGVTGLPTR